MLKMGFFRNFNGADSVLLDGAPEDIAVLSRRLEQFSASSEPSLPIHAMATVSKRHPADLFVLRVAQFGNNGYHWLCSVEQLEFILGMLEPLTKKAVQGHQYFDLLEPAKQLVVSVGEYGSDWWQQHG